MIQNYLKTYDIDKYEVGTYFESLDEKLRFDNINLLESLRLEASNSPIISTMGLLSVTGLILTFVIIYFRRHRTPQLTPEQLLDQRVERIQILVRSYEDAERSS